MTDLTPAEEAAAALYPPKDNPDADYDNFVKRAAYIKGDAAGYARAKDGWKEATIAWAVCRSLHREYAKGLDPFFTTRQADFEKHENAARALAEKEQS